jgi:D-3-phosphoglycerate dehydrogenase / 2-oxoglutarate reductase
MLVLIADAFEQSGLDGLRRAGCDVRHDPSLKDDALAAALEETSADVLVVRSTKVTAAMMQGSALALIVRAGAGYNTIDVAEASRRGIYVSNCPARNAVAVAELTLGLMLAIDRRIPDNVADLRVGLWNKKRYADAQGLLGRTLGILGAGAIALEVIRRAAAFGMPVVLWSRRFDGQEGALDAPTLRDLGLDEAARLVPIECAPTPAAVAARADVLSVHLALAPATRDLVGASVLAALRDGAMFLNTSRSEIVDPDALTAAVRDRGIRAGLDVFAHEPAGGSGSFDDTIVQQGLVYGTHHIGASTAQAQEAIAAETVRIITAFKTTGQVPNVVNLAHRSPATHRLIVRHRDKPGVLAHVFDQLRSHAINVQETENVVFAGAEAAIARINLDGQPSRDLLDVIRHGHPDVLTATVVAL